LFSATRRSPTHTITPSGNLPLNDPRPEAWIALAGASLGLGAGIGGDVAFLGSGELF
jgi:hypothetical protein